jgi:hypothetical protein
MTLAAGTGAIEVIDKGSSSDIHPAPLLFVHGGWHAAWCWDEHFLDFFADAGYRAIALSLRGHGSSPNARPLSQCSVADYVEDVCSVADGLPTSPVLIGHSMGGFLVQMYLTGRSTAKGGCGSARHAPTSAGSRSRQHNRQHCRPGQHPPSGAGPLFLPTYSRLRCRIMCRTRWGRELGRPGVLGASQARKDKDSAPCSRRRKRQARYER